MAAVEEEQEDCCPICYEDFAEDDVEAAARTSDDKDRIAIASHSSSNDDDSSPCCCQHAFCRACLRDYCQHEILMRKIPIRCPSRSSHASQTCTTSPDKSSSSSKNNNNNGKKKGNRSKSKSSASSSSSPSPSVRVGGCQAVLSEALVHDILRESPEEQAEEVLKDDLKNETASSEDKDFAYCNKTINPYWIKYQRYQKLAQDPSLVACPLCDELVGRHEEPQQSPLQYAYDDDEENQQHHQESSSWSKLRRYCSDCQLEFCAHHGHLLHAPDADACAAYTKRLQQQSSNSRQQQTDQTLQAYTKPCSHCGCRLQKFAGCDHVVCPACQNDMCFQCGTHVYLSSPPMKRQRNSNRNNNNHDDDDNNNNSQQQEAPQQQQQQQEVEVDVMYRHCAMCKQGYIDHRYAHRYQRRMLLLLPLYLPFMLLYTAIVGGILFPLTGLFCCCFGCGTSVDNEPLAPPPRQRQPQPQPQRYGRHDGSSSATPAADTRGGGGLSPMRGVVLSFCVIFLPFLLVLHDFGFESDFIDNLFEQQNNNNRNQHRSTSIGVSEIPTMPLDADGADANDDDDDDMSGIVELVDDSQDDNGVP